jgi:hypothetical protein
VTDYTRLDITEAQRRSNPPVPPGTAGAHDGLLIMIALLGCYVLPVYMLANTVFAESNGGHAGLPSYTLSFVLATLVWVVWGKSFLSWLVGVNAPSSRRSPRLVNSVPKPRVRL